MPPTPRTAALRRVVYNEIEPYAAAWLRNLSSAGHIATGTVNAASISDLAPSDVAATVQFHTFAGLGAWSYALRLAGWPDERPVWTGSCPCQPFSVAGKGAGTADERHLWPEWFRLIRECRPVVLFGEQVASPAGLEWLAREDARVSRLRDGEAVLRVLHQLEGGPEAYLQGLHEVRREDEEAEQSGGNEAGFRSLAGRESREGPLHSRQVPGEAEGSVLRSGRGGHSAEDRRERVRVDGGAVRLNGRQDLGQSFAGQNRLDAGVHAGQRSGGAVLRQRDGERVGAEEDPGHRGRYSRANLEGGARTQRELVDALGLTFDADVARGLLGSVHADLEGAGYAVGAAVLPAAGVGAPHIRHRIYFGAVRLADADARGRGELGERYGGTFGGEPTSFGHDAGGRGEVRRLADAAGERRSRERHQPAHGFAGPGRSEVRGPWDDVEWLACTDGKFRPTKPGIFPLAHGAPARVGRLRAYGNAIVPQVAATFIRAFMDEIDGIGVA
jgi:DNA (cytosine-5)-methyltransferase 1